MFGDNHQTVVNSCSMPNARLHKGHLIISFHRIREAVAAKVLHFIHTLHNEMGTRGGGYCCNVCTRCAYIRTPVLFLAWFIFSLYFCVVPTLVCVIYAYLCGIAFFFLDVPPLLIPFRLRTYILVRFISHISHVIIADVDNVVRTGYTCRPCVLRATVYVCSARSLLLFFYMFILFLRVCCIARVMSFLSFQTYTYCLPQVEFS
jgi:hypothetical protein